MASVTRKPLKPLASSPPGSERLFSHCAGETVQIAGWLAETRPHQDSAYQTSAAVRAVENSERYTNVVYKAGHDQFSIVINGNTLGKTRIKSDIIVLEGK